MLLIDTYISESKIKGAGIGCYSKNFIPKGTKIWEFNFNLDRKITQKEYALLSDFEKEYINKYAYMFKRNYYLCIDNARFFNHSVEECNTYDPINEFATYALTDIMPDQEILSNYKTFGFDEYDNYWNIIL